MKNMIPYSVYLPAKYHEKIRELAKERKASSTVRDAIQMILDGDGSYEAGYRRAMKDCIKIVDSCKEIEHIAIRGKYLSEVLIDQLEQLEP